MRIENSLKNIKFGVVGQILTLLGGFFTRTVFVYYLSIEYLGINGLFANILTIFSLANMGIGAALSFSLYKPIADNDYEKITYLNNLLKKAYRWIGLFILIAGILTMPFLNLLIKDGHNVEQIEVIFLIFLFNYIFPYFWGFSYRSLITAHQKGYIFVFANTVSILIMDILQIIALIITKDFIIYLIIQSICTAGTYFYIRHKAISLYPFIKKKTSIELKGEEKKSIKKNIIGSIYQNVGFVSSNGIDNVLISSFIGIAQLGMYANYNFLILAVQSIVKQFFTSLIASIGNFNVKESNEKKVFIFNTVFFTNFWIYGFSTISLYILCNPFIQLWIGEKYLLDSSTVLLIVINFYIFGMQTTSDVFRSSLGLFWHGRYRPIIEALINLILSIVLIQKFGLNGIFLGTILSTLIISFWYDPMVIFKYGVYEKMLNYIRNYLFYGIATIFVGLISWFICAQISDETVIDFILKVIICFIIPNLLFVIIFFRREEFLYLFRVVKKVIVRRIIA